MKYYKIIDYHFQVNGLIERFNRTPKQTLAKISKGVEDQDKFIALAILKYGKALCLPRDTLPHSTIWERVQHMIIQVLIFREQAIDKIKQSHMK